MVIDKKTNTIFCFFCNTWYNFNQVFLHVLYEGSITCFRDHLCGNDFDDEWQELFYWCEAYYKYHGKGQCRCVFDDSECFGQKEQCTYPLGRAAWEADHEDTKKLNKVWILEVDMVLEIYELAKKHGKKAGDSIQEEFEEIQKLFPEKFKSLGVTTMDKDLLLGNLREEGVKIKDISHKKEE